MALSQAHLKVPLSQEEPEQEMINMSDIQWISDAELKFLLTNMFM